MLKKISMLVWRNGNMKLYSSCIGLVLISLTLLTLMSSLYVVTGQNEPEVCNVLSGLIGSAGGGDVVALEGTPKELAPEPAAVVTVGGYTVRLYYCHSNESPFNSPPFKVIDELSACEEKGKNPLQAVITREEELGNYLSLVIRFGFYSTPETLDKLIESGKVAQPPEEVINVVRAVGELVQGERSSGREPWVLGICTRCHPIIIVVSHPRAKEFATKLEDALLPLRQEMRKRDVVFLILDRIEPIRPVPEGGEAREYIRGLADMLEEQGVYLGILKFPAGNETFYLVSTNPLDGAHVLVVYTDLYKKVVGEDAEALRVVGKSVAEVLAAANYPYSIVDVVVAGPPEDRVVEVMRTSAEKPLSPASTTTPPPTTSLPEELSQLEDHAAPLSTTTSMEWGENPPPEESQTTARVQESENTHYVTEASTSSARSTQRGYLLVVAAAIAMVVLLIVLAAKARK